MCADGSERRLELLIGQQQEPLTEIWEVETDLEEAAALEEDPVGEKNAPALEKSDETCSEGHHEYHSWIVKNATSWMACITIRGEALVTTIILS